MAGTGDERRVTANPFGPAGTRVIVAPFQFMVDGTDHLRIEGWNSASGAALQVNGRFFNEDGTIDALSHSLPLTADRVRNSMDTALAKGFLTNLVVTVTGATPKVGQTFARVSVIRGLTGATIVLGVLLQGYCTDRQVQAWPGSPIQNAYDIDGFYRNETQLGPIGTVVSVSCPTGAHWTLASIAVQLTSSAVVANRKVFLMMVNVAQLWRAVSPTTQPATTVGAYSWVPGMTGNLGELPTPTFTMPLPIGAELVAGDSLQIFAQNIDAADVFNQLIYKVRERLEVN